MRLICNKNSLFLILVFFINSCGLLKKEHVIFEKDFHKSTNLNGKYSVINDDNLLLFKYKFHNGKSIGWRYEYGSNGLLIRKYRNATRFHKGLYINFHPNGQLATLETFNMESLNDGRYCEYYSNGVIKYRGNYKVVNGYIISNIDSINNTIVILKPSDQKESVKVGTWKSYFEEGLIKTEEEYSNFFLQINYFTDSIDMKTMSSLSIHSWKKFELKCGLWLIYDSLGVVTQKVNYQTLKPNVAKLPYSLSFPGNHSFLVPINQ